MADEFTFKDIEPCDQGGPLFGALEISLHGQSEMVRDDSFAAPAIRHLLARGSRQRRCRVESAGGAAMKEAKDHRRTSPEGRKLGAFMARIVATEIAALAAEDEPDERCVSCAFRLGTVPNGCFQTQSDVIKAVSENVPFMCHSRRAADGSPDTICWGWFAARRVLMRLNRPLPPTPWEFSPPDEPKPRKEAAPQ